jgi:hypothetical protein
MTGATSHTSMQWRSQRWGRGDWSPLLPPPQPPRSEVEEEEGWGVGGTRRAADCGEEEPESLRPPPRAEPQRRTPASNALWGQIRRRRVRIRRFQGRLWRDRPESTTAAMDAEVAQGRGRVEEEEREAGPSPPSLRPLGRRRGGAPVMEGTAAPVSPRGGRRGG